MQVSGSLFAKKKGRLHSVVIVLCTFLFFRILTNDCVIKQARQNLFFEKPYLRRNRLSYERCQRIYNTDMRRKVEFVMRKNRVDPWLR